MLFIIQRSAFPTFQDIFKMCYSLFRGLRFPCFGINLRSVPDQKMIYTNPDPGIKNSENTDLDPVLDLYLFQDSTLELNRESDQLYFTSWCCPEPQWSSTAFSSVFSVCILGIPVF